MSAFTNAYAGVFNSSSNPIAPAIMIDGDGVLERAINAMREDATFVRNVFVEVPVVENVPLECKERELPYFEQLEQIFLEV